MRAPAAPRLASCGGQMASFCGGAAAASDGRTSDERERPAARFTGSHRGRSRSRAAWARRSRRRRRWRSPSRPSPSRTTTWRRSASRGGAAAALGARAFFDIALWCTTTCVVFSKRTGTSSSNAQKPSRVTASLCTPIGRLASGPASGVLPTVDAVERDGGAGHVAQRWRCCRRAARARPGGRRRRGSRRSAPRASRDSVAVTRRSSRPVSSTSFRLTT